MIQRGRANGTDIISRDMTLEAVPLPLLSHFSPTSLPPSSSDNIWLDLSQWPCPQWKLHGKCPETLQVANCISALFHPNPWKQPTRGLNQWNKKQEQEKVPVREYHWLVIFYSTMKTLTSSGVISFSERPYVYLIYFVDFQWRSSMHQIHWHPLWLAYETRWPLLFSDVIQPFAP